MICGTRIYSKVGFVSPLLILHWHKLIMKLWKSQKFSKKSQKFWKESKILKSVKNFQKNWKIWKKWDFWKKWKKINKSQEYQNSEDNEKFCKKWKLEGVFHMICGTRIYSKVWVVSPLLILHWHKLSSEGLTFMKRNWFLRSF